MTSCSAVKHSTNWANSAVVSQGNKVNNTKESKVAGFEPPSWHYAAFYTELVLHMGQRVSTTEKTISGIFGWRKSILPTHFLQKETTLGIN